MRPNGLEGGRAAPHGRHLVVAAVAEVEGHRDPRLGKARPYPVVGGMPEGPPSRSRNRHRCRSDMDDACAHGDHPVDLGDGSVRVGERDHRDGEDPVLVRVAPVVLEPAVEGVERRHRGGDVVAQRLLEADGEGRVEDRTREPLLGEDLDSLVAVAVLGGDGLHLHERLAALALRDPTAEVEVEAAGLGDGIERGVRDEAVYPLAHHDDHALALL